MAFNSFAFVCAFMPVAVLTHGFLLRFGGRWAQAWLLAASLFFYASATTANVPVLAASIAVNWVVTNAMIRERDQARRRWLLWAGLALNITALFLFKYVNLFLALLADAHGPRLRFPDWGFPLGISFFTLIQIMYLVDAYPRPPTSEAGRKLFRGITQPASLFDHATFVALFPYIVSGPLVNARATMAQLHKYDMREERLALACRGLYLFSIGLVKKVVIADSFAPLSDAGFGALRDFSTLEAWIFCASALLNLYFDFSGYSDMALGSAWMLGINIPQNFNAPLRAQSIADFWQRWHISLSRFITEYLYRPLLRAFGHPTLASSAVATVLAMTIAALWHGPAWTFVAWGLCHGVALAVHQIWKKRKLEMPGWAGWVLTMLFLTSTIVFLKAANLGAAGHMLAGLLPHANLLGVETLRKTILISPTLVFRPIFIGAAAAILFRTSMQLADGFRPTWRTAMATATMLLFAFVYMNSAPARQFIYFQF